MDLTEKFKCCGKTLLHGVLEENLLAGFQKKLAEQTESKFQRPRFRDIWKIGNKRVGLDNNQGQGSIIWHVHENPP